jgi:transcriptional regulator with XRE-family HTH domain
MEFSLIVKEKLAQRNLKIPEFARLSGISYPYLIDLLKGRRRWNEDTIKKACAALGMEINFKDLKPTGTDGGE